MRGVWAWVGGDGGGLLIAVEMRRRDGFPSFPFFFLSGLLEMRRRGRGKSGIEGMACRGGIGCHCWVLFHFFLRTYLHMFWGNLLRTYFGLGIVGVKRMDGVWGVWIWIWVGWMERRGGSLDGMGREDGMGKGKGKGREGKEECYVGSVCSVAHSLAQSIYLIIVGSLDNTYYGIYTVSRGYLDGIPVFCVT